MSHYPGPKLLNWIVCYTEQGHLSLWKHHKCLFLYKARELTFSQGRETGWGHPARIHPPQPSSHEGLNILLFPACLCFSVHLASVSDLKEGRGDHKEVPNPLWGTSEVTEVVSSETSRGSLQSSVNQLWRLSRKLKGWINFMTSANAGACQIRLSGKEVLQGWGSVLHLLSALVHPKRLVLNG